MAKGAGKAAHSGGGGGKASRGQVRTKPQLVCQLEACRPAVREMFRGAEAARVPQHDREH